MDLAGVTNIYESGVNQNVTGDYTASTTILKIERVGTTLTYYKDGVSQRVVNSVTTAPLYADTAMYDSGSTLGPVTAGKTIAAGSRFVLINAAVIFVPAQITDLNGLLSYRGVTSGQSLADAATVQFAWTGGGLRPLSPVNVRGIRNSIGDLLTEWTRRNRVVPGMIPRSDVPLGEEIEQYDVEFLTTGNVLKRTMRVLPGGAQAAVLLPLAPQYAQTISRNSVNVEGTVLPAGNLTIAYPAQQIVNSGGWVEATLEITSTLPQAAYIDLRLSNEIGFNTPPTIYYSLRFANSFGTFEVYKEATLKYSATVAGTTLARIRIIAVGSEVRFYWDYTGPGSVPFYVSIEPLPLPLTPQITLIGPCKASNVFVGANADDPSVIYSTNQQIIDGFLPNVTPIRVRIYQISSIIGRGDVGESTL